MYETSRDIGFRNKIRLHPDAEIALSYYAGTLKALGAETESKIALFVYDCGTTDSMISVVMKKPELKKMDVMIGAVSTSGAKLVADFCRQNKIVNIQPFSPSKTLTSDNPYHLKLAPIIDAHVDAMFNSIVDSFIGGNVIIYTPAIEKSLQVAQRFDSLFRDFNKSATTKFSVSFLNTKDMTVNGKKTTAAELLKAGKPNIWIITSFDESFVNGNMRVLYAQRKEHRIIVYGMPTWLNGDVLRLDYINDFNSRITDSYLPDTNNVSTSVFVSEYLNDYGVQPDRYAYLGYDVTRFLVQAFRENGKNFLPKIATQRYKGTAYVFDIQKSTIKQEVENGVNFYENRHVNVLGVTDYKLVKQ